MRTLNENTITDAVLDQISGTPDPRFKQIMEAAVRHLHAFAREVKLTEAEYQLAASYVVALGQKSSESHNEAILMGGVLGLSSLVCLLNNGDNGATETTANLLGPFWRTDSPRTPNGGSIVRSPTPGEPIFVNAWIKDPQGRPVAGAEVDVWHSSTEGYYENQDPVQADMNLRGKFTSDTDGHIAFRSIKPAGYPVPVEGPVGALLRAQHRANMRPAHLHFLVYRSGFKTVTSQIYSPDDPHLDTDSQFGVTRALVGHFENHENEPAPDREVTGAWYSLQHTFILQLGESWLPTPPISKKATERVR